jgi:hypothetical protein
VGLEMGSALHRGSNDFIVFGAVEHARKTRGCIARCILQGCESHFSNSCGNVTAWQRPRVILLSLDARLGDLGHEQSALHAGPNIF